MGLIEVKLRPLGPWRAGHRAGDRERVDVIYHSDALYSAITHAMGALGWMELWLDATARADEPAVRFSSLFPFVGKTRLIPPPRPVGGMKLVPLELARGGFYDPARWQPDVACESLLPQGVQPPFRISIRSAAAVDRLSGAAEPHRVACLEFAGNAGWWGVFEATADWEPRVKSALRLLADSGFGGERSRGWGRSAEPVFSTATALFPDRTPNGTWWLLSLFSPNEADQIDWMKSTQTVTVRAGWTDSPHGSGPKRQVRMIEEGSVLCAESLRGRSVDVSPEGFPHPVYRNGSALAVPVPAMTPEPTLPEPQPDLPEPEPNGPAVEATSSESEPHQFPEPAEPEPQLPPPDPEPELPGLLDPLPDPEFTE